MMDQDSQDQELSDLFDEFDQRTDAAPASPEKKTGRKRSPRVYRSALDELQTDRRSAAKATGKKASIAGNYIRRSFTYRPDQLDSIEDIADQLGLSKNDVMRWFADMGIEAVEQGERPPLAEEVRRKYDPGLRHD